MAVKEWTDPYTSFNSMKGLAYMEHYKAIVSDNLLPPIEASLDPVADCQLSCQWCNSYAFIHQKGSLYPSMAMRKMPPGHLLELSKFLIDFGCLSGCLGGGGEPSLHEDCPATIKLWHDRGRQIAFVTNGIKFSHELLEALPLCRWIGVSVDAAGTFEYECLKGRDAFWQVLGNIDRLVFRASKGCDISYKFLIVPENYHSLVDACKIARDLGVREFHARPASTDRREVYKGEHIAYDIAAIQDHFAACHAMETETFRVITSFHKFSSDFHIANNFSRCWASALQVQCCADGGVYLCQDTRIESNRRLGSHYPNPADILSWWGKAKHLQILKRIDPQKDCPRCTFGPYNEQVERVVLDDSMCVNFP